MGQPSDIRCWRCGCVLDAALFPLRREEPCPDCNADLHVCKLCRFYNPALSDGCDEPLAGGVRDKERANFCDYLEPTPRAYRGAGGAAARARADLEALFDAAPGGPAGGDDDGDAQRAELERLFGVRKGSSE